VEITVENETVYDSDAIREIFRRAAEVRPAAIYSRGDPSTRHLVVRVCYWRGSKLRKIKSEYNYDTNTAELKIVAPNKLGDSVIDKLVIVGDSFLPNRDVLKIAGCAERLLRGQQGAFAAKPSNYMGIHVGIHKDQVLGVAAEWHKLRLKQESYKANRIRRRIAKFNAQLDPIEKRIVEHERAIAKHAGTIRFVE
jgi:hypothetical protein